ncbi:hypothetical protein [Haloferula sargassicola]|uniref:hypothetical protein n=1 Tax=Haloferula sargassicola TaxID=490096 RepID=UPI00336561BE
MQILETRQSLRWGELDVPVFGIDRDWHGRAVEPAAGWCVVVDPASLWMIATRHAAGVGHPEAAPLAYHEGLWEHEAAELFVASPDRSRYLEINLAPQGAWWGCLFDAPRVRAAESWPAGAGVEAFAARPDESSWLAAIRLPLDFLRETLSFGATSPMNLTFVLDPPRHRYLTVADLGGGEPDFHQPGRFPLPAWIDVDASKPC